MAWVAVDKDGTEVIGINKPFRDGNYWSFPDENYGALCKYTIISLIGYSLTWNDDPVELNKFAIFKEGVD